MRITNLLRILYTISCSTVIFSPKEAELARVRFVLPADSLDTDVTKSSSTILSTKSSMISEAQVATSIVEFSSSISDVTQDTAPLSSNLLTVSTVSLSSVLPIQISTASSSSIPTAGGLEEYVHDNSLDKVEAIISLMESNDHAKKIFDPKFVQSLSTSSGAQSYFNYVENASFSAQNTNENTKFFMQAANQFKTNSNCYIVRAKSQSPNEILQTLETVLKSVDGDVRRHYEDGIKGYSVCFPDGVLPLNLLKSIPWLSYVERDQIFGVKQVQQNAPWGLARISNPKNLNGNQFTFNLTGEGVNIYTIDSGIWIQHKEFGPRAKLVFSSFGSGVNFDCSGHGTEVASVAAGLTVGVAKKANINVAQVLDCDGQGQNSDLVAAIDWIIRNHQKPAVVNMSVGGPPSQSVDDAVKALIARGVPVVIAAGNSATDACSQSPSRVDAAIVVGASNERNERASFSNFGSCLDIFAPGTNIYAAAIPKKSADGYSYVSGTSLSAPFVTGVVALRLQQYPYATPLEIYTWLIAASKSDILQQSSLYASPNNIVYIPASATSKDLVDFDSAPPPSNEIPPPATSTLKIPLGVIFVSVGSTIGLLCALSLVVWGIKKIIRKRRDSKEPTDIPRDAPNTWSSQPFL